MSQCHCHKTQIQVKVLSPCFPHFLNKLHDLGDTSESCITKDSAKKMNSVNGCICFLYSTWLTAKLKMGQGCRDMASKNKNMIRKEA